MQERKILYLSYQVEHKQTLLVMQNKENRYLKQTPEKILNKICCKYGATIQQRCVFIQNRFHFQQKTPIVIDPYRELLFFPVYGKRCHNRIWIAYNKVIKIKAQDCNTILYFEGNECLVLPLYYRGLKKQMNRCKEIINILSQL